MDIDIFCHCRIFLAYKKMNKGENRNRAFILYSVVFNQLAVNHLPSQLSMIRTMGFSSILYTRLVQDLAIIKLPI